MTSRQIFAGNRLKTLINVKHVSVKTVGGIPIFVTLIFNMCICFKFRNNTLSHIKNIKKRKDTKWCTSVLDAWTFQGHLLCYVYIYEIGTWSLLTVRKSMKSVLHLIPTFISVLLMMKAFNPADQPSTHIRPREINYLLTYSMEQGPSWEAS